MQIESKFNKLHLYICIVKFWKKKKKTYMYA